MIKRNTVHNITWLDVFSPSKEDLNTLSNDFSLDPRIIQEIASPTPRPLVYTYGQEIFAVLHFPANRQSRSEKEKYEQEVNFIIGQNFLITVRYDTIDTIHRFSKMAFVDSAIQHEEKDTNGARVFISLLNAFYKSTDDELRYLEDWTDNIEKKIFRGEEKAMVVALSEVSRVLTDFKKTLSLRTDSLKDLAENVQILFGNTELDSFNKIIERHQKFINTINHEIRIVKEFRQTNNSLLYTKQNEIVKNLTIMASLTLPVTMIASLFGMNTKNSPIIGQTEDFWIILIISAIASLSIFLYFKHKKWF